MSELHGGIEDAADSADCTQNLRYVDSNGHLFRE
jgi:hypothetical protein